MPEEVLPADISLADWRSGFNEWQLREIDRAEHYVNVLGYQNLDRTSYGTIYRLARLLDIARHQLANERAGAKLQDYVQKRKAELADQESDLDDTQEIATT